MYPITTLPTEFGKKGRARVRRLLEAFGSSTLNRSSLREPVTAFYHRVTGKAHLTDSDERTAVLHLGVLRDWHLCLSCQNQGIPEDFFADPEYGKRCGYCGEKALWL